MTATASTLIAAPLARTGPDFQLRERVLDALAAVFERFTAGPDLRDVLSCAALLQDGVVLLSGGYGTGKTTFVGLLARALFLGHDHEPDLAQVACTQDLTPLDVLYHLDLAELRRGREVVHPKPIVGARLKFLNEIQRAGATVHNALLPLLSERRVSYRQQEFASPPALVLLDRNPSDAGSSELPRAFLDRIDVSVDVAPAHGVAAAALLERRAGPARWLPLGERWDGPSLLAEETALAWLDVARVAVPRPKGLLAVMLVDAFRLCVRGERSLMRADHALRCDECSFQAEPCARVAIPPGHRAAEGLVRLAQARAWLAGRARVEDEDVVFGLPYVLAHRLELRREALLEHATAQDWLKDTWRHVLGRRQEAWGAALQALEAGALGELEVQGRHDLVVRELARALRPEGAPAEGEP